MVELDPTLLLGVGAGPSASSGVSEARSSLFPTSRRLTLGDASARVSLRKGCSARNDACDDTS